MHLNVVTVMPNIIYPSEVVKAWKALFTATFIILSLPPNKDDNKKKKINQGIEKSGIGKEMKWNHAYKRIKYKSIEHSHICLPSIN